MNHALSRTLLSGFFLGLFFDPEDESYAGLRKVSYHRR
jgi:hypothetical protein